MPIPAICDKPCQLYAVRGLTEPIPLIDNLWQRRKRARRIFKRRLRYLQNMIAELFTTRTKAGHRSKDILLQATDLVRVRSHQEIQITLNRWNQLHGCAFMEEMWQYCGTLQRVRKPVRVFLDERSYLTRRSKHLFILENVICEGTRDFGPCDRSCFFFWREEWLEKVEQPDSRLAMVTMERCHGK